MEGTQRDRYGRLHGETPVQYRMVFELDPPLVSHQKGKDGGNEISRAEFFSDDVRVFYFLNAALGRMTKVTRAEAIILKDGSVASWADRNKNEQE